jgi:hypothetical protein
VSAQFDYVGGAGPGACFGVGDPPQVQVIVQPFPGGPNSEFNDEGVATYGQPVDVCFEGMGRGPISVTVHGPDDFTMSGVLPALPAGSDYEYNGEWSAFDWVPAIMPSWPQGKYLITGSNGTIRRTHTLTLVRPTAPGLRVLGPSTDPGHNSVPPNSRAELFLTGFRGGSRVKLLTYRTRGFGPHAKFFSAATVRVPASGDEMVRIPTGPAHGTTEPTFVVTVQTHGITLLAPFTVSGSEGLPDVIVGTLRNP